MKFKTLLAALLVAALLMSPVALMEELPEIQDVVLEESAQVVEEEVKTEPEPEAAQPDTEEIVPVDEATQPVEAETVEAEQEIASEPVDAVVEEAEDADLYYSLILEANAEQVPNNSDINPEIPPEPTVDGDWTPAPPPTIGDEENNHDETPTGLPVVEPPTPTIQEPEYWGINIFPAIGEEGTELYLKALAYVDDEHALFAKADKIVTLKIEKGTKTVLENLFVYGVAFNADDIDITKEVGLTKVDDNTYVFTMPDMAVYIGESHVLTSPTNDPDPTPTTTTEQTAPATTVSAPVEPITIARIPASTKAKAKKNKVTVSWKKIKKSKKTKALLGQIKSIEVQYSTDPNFAADVNTKSVSKKKTKVTLKLQKKTQYYVRVRYVGTDGVSNWSAVKRVKTK